MASAKAGPVSLSVGHDSLTSGVRGESDHGRTMGCAPIVTVAANFADVTKCAIGTWDVPHTGPAVADIARFCIVDVPRIIASACVVGVPTLP